MKFKINFSENGGSLVVSGIGIATQTNLDLQQHKPRNRFI
jgi:hypothetical protein